MAKMEKNRRARTKVLIKTKKCRCLRWDAILVVAWSHTDRCYSSDKGNAKPLTESRTEKKGEKDVCLISSKVVETCPLLTSCRLKATSQVPTTLSWVTVKEARNLRVWRRQQRSTAPWTNQTDQPRAIMSQARRMIEYAVILYKTFNKPCYANVTSNVRYGSAQAF